MSRPPFVSFAALVLALPILAQTTSSSPTTSDPKAIALPQKSLASLTNSAQIRDVALSGSARRIAGCDDETGTEVLGRMQEPQS